VALRGIHHVGMAVSDLDEAIATYRELLGAQVEHRAALEADHVEAAFVLVGGSRVELLSPTADDSPVGRFLAKRGPGMHHVAYEADDVRETLEELRAGGAELVDPAPRPGLLGLEVAFVHPDAVHGVLTEVVSGG